MREQFANYALLRCKIIAWKSGSVKLLANIMSRCDHCLGLIQIPAATAMPGSTVHLAMFWLERYDTLRKPCSSVVTIINSFISTVVWGVSKSSVLTKKNILESTFNRTDQNGPTLMFFLSCLWARVLEIYEKEEGTCTGRRVQKQKGLDDVQSSRAFTLHPGFQTPGSTVLRQRFGQALCKTKNGRRMVSGPQHQNSFHLLSIG